MSWVGIWSGCTVTTGFLGEGRGFSPAAKGRGARDFSP
jgi:hypothetical protein